MSTATSSMTLPFSTPPPRPSGTTRRHSSRRRGQPSGRGSTARPGSPRPFHAEHKAAVVGVLLRRRMRTVKPTARVHCLIPEARVCRPPQRRRPQVARRNSSRRPGKMTFLMPNMYHLQKTVEQQSARNASMSPLQTWTWQTSFTRSRRKSTRRPGSQEVQYGQNPRPQRMPKSPLSHPSSPA